MSAVSDMQQIQEWFLRRGLPLVLTRRVRSRDLIVRSAPVVSGVGAVTAVMMLLAEVTAGDPDYGYAVRLGSIAAALVAAPFALYLLHHSGTRLGEAGRRTAALLVMAIFVVAATIRDEVRALREDRAEQSDPGELLAGTPLAGCIEHDPVRTPLSSGEQLNVVAVMVVPQAIQVVFFTAGLFAFFLALGVIAIPYDVAVLWSAEATCSVGQPPCAGTWFGIHMPVPQTIVHTSLFVAVLSGLYFTVSTSVDPLYRQRFFDPLIADVAVSLAQPSK
ncbi:MAG: hypothetical protein QOF25_2175 [Mycobacterium sp.]|jgi:hypothetical protein|nr:hypothetical protein [Mycobacterium sp.]